MNTNQPTRRNFLQVAGAGALASLGSPLEVFAGAVRAEVVQATAFETPYLLNVGFTQATVFVIDTAVSVTWVELVDGGTTRKIVNQQDWFLVAGRGPKSFKINNLV